MAREEGVAAGEYFARAIFPDPSPLFCRRPIPRDDEVKWINRPASGKLTGMIFSDGSARWPRVAALRRAGWALVQVDPTGSMVAAAYGPVPFAAAPYQQARDGEDYAAHMSAWLVEPPFELFVDCNGTLECLLGPPGYSTAPTNVRAHLWGPFWASFEATDFQAHKTKAHTTVEDVDRGITTHWERKANAAADKYAKQGASLHAVPEPDRWLWYALDLIAKEAARWAGSLEAHRADLEIKDADELTAPVAGGQSHTDEALAAEGADNGLHTPAVAPPAQEGREPSTGPFRINDHMLMSADILPGNGRVFFCSRCGAYAVEKFRLLRRLCQGHHAPGLKVQRQLLRNGRFPGRRGASLGRVVALEPDQREWVRKKLAGSAARAAAQRPRVTSVARPGLSRGQLLACFGLRLGEEEEAANWAKGIFETRQAKRQQAAKPGSVSEPRASSGEDWFSD